MPQASDELRKKMADYYGGAGISDWPPLQYLLKHGWTESEGFLEAPTPLKDVPEQEFLSALFLRDEWDYDFTKEQKEEFDRGVLMS